MDVKIFCRKGAEKDERHKAIEASQVFKLEKNLSDEIRILTDERLKRPYFDLHRVEWPDATDGEVEFHLNHGDWIRLLTGAGFDILDLVEARVPPGATTTYAWMDAAWASRWPCEEAWIARRR